MYYKYSLKFKLLDNYPTRTIKAKSTKQAFISLLNSYPMNSISQITLIEPPRPSIKGLTVAQVKKKAKAKERQLKGFEKFLAFDNIQ